MCVGRAARWSSASDGEISPYLISTNTVSTLKDITDVILRAGYGPELCQVYSEVRRDTRMGCLAVLGVDKMSLEQVQHVEWGILDGKMKKWIQALRVVVQGLLAEERRICGQILAADTDAKEECFTEATKGCVLQLLNFGDAIAIGKRSSEKLFRILGMYGFRQGRGRGDTRESRTLGDAVRGIVAEFANAIHPPAYALCHELCATACWLNHLLDGCETELENGGDNADMTPLGHCLLILITHLLDKIEDKAKLCDDEALQNIFLMNNLWYVVQKIKDSELKSLLGDNWIRKRRMMHGLPQTIGSSSALKAALKERFKSTAWKVVDPQLREELKISISEKVLQAYRSNFAKYIKYNPEDVEN
ncbi:hypothetical protein VPH35_071242 [Triticum aestivum]